MRGACCAFLALSGACSGKNTGYEPNFVMTSPVEPPLRAGCNPLGGLKEEDCFTPFPSSFYTTRDPSGTERVRIPGNILPATVKGVALDPAPLNGRNGYSPATPLIAYLPTPGTSLDDSNLPRYDAPADSLSAKSTVQLIAWDSGERVPVMAELDRNANSDERQGLIIYPQLRLRPHTRYIVAIFGLRSQDGKAVPATSGFASLRDGRLDPGSVRFGLRPRYDEIFALLEKQGVPRKELQLAWDFTTASDEPLFGRLIRMRDRAFAFKQPMMGGAVGLGGRAGHGTNVSVSTPTAGMTGSGR